MLGSVGDRQIEDVAVRGLDGDVESDPVYSAREARDDLPANRLDNPQLFEDPQFGRNRRPAASGSLGDLVVGREALTGQVAVEALQEGPEHVQALGLQNPPHAAADRVYGDPAP